MTTCPPAGSLGYRGWEEPLVKVLTGRQCFQGLPLPAQGQPEVETTFPCCPLCKAGHRLLLVLLSISMYSPGNIFSFCLKDCLSFNPFIPDLLFPQSSCSLNTAANLLLFIVKTMEFFHQTNQKWVAKAYPVLVLCLFFREAWNILEIPLSD